MWPVTLPASWVATELRRRLEPERAGVRVQLVLVQRERDARALAAATAGVGGMA
jgi:hypothetical protein